MPAFQDLTGHKYGRLTVKSYVGERKWRCLCDCGREHVAFSFNMRQGKTTSCGCLHDEGNNLRHGKTDTSEFRIWKAMRQRCENVKSKSYPNYGGRGIKVNPDWQDFSTFYKDMGVRPEGYSIERVNNDGDYCKENCVWADRKTQQLNTRRNRHLTYNGETKTIREWSDAIGLDYFALLWRMDNGWSDEESLTIPSNNAIALNGV